VATVDAYVIVFSVTDETSFSFASACLQTIQRRASNSYKQPASVILVANKNDLVRNRTVTDHGNAAYRFLLLSIIIRPGNGSPSDTNVVLLAVTC